MEITAKQRIERLEETSEAILKELKKISYDIKDRSKEGSDEEISNDQAEKPLFRWYEHTLPGPELDVSHSAEAPDDDSLDSKSARVDHATEAGSISRAEMGQQSLLRSSETLGAKYENQPGIGSDQIEPSVEAVKDDGFTKHSEWGFKYESPFRDFQQYTPSKGVLPKDETKDVENKILSLSGKRWAIPKDGRIKLSLTPEALHISLYERLNFSRLNAFTFLKALQKYDVSMVSRAASFEVGDLDPWNDVALVYDSTSEGIAEVGCRWRINWGNQSRHVESQVDVDRNYFQPKLLLKPGESLSHLESIAPWRRIILLEGLEGLAKMPDQVDLCTSCPWIALTTWIAQPAIRHALDLHLEGAELKGNRSANPYVNDLTPFHLRFFEADRKAERWKTGKLFSNGSSNNRSLRRSCFTVFVASPARKSDEDDDFTKPLQALDEYLDPMYTVLLLQPKGFPIKPTHPWYHMVKVGYSFQEVLRSNTKIEAELFCIIAGLVTIVRRWGDLDEYLGELLVEDFMHPDEYVKLLFDDGNFTRSQEYFWAIGALNEFGVLITENISQWDLYYEGRIQNLLQMKNLAYLFDAACLMKPDNTTAEQNGRKRLREFKDLIKKGEVQREALVELQARFERKLETIKALRDGLFNASALLESRASTRLGENVKLLTYVSIFYLPLAFCAALWAIPNIQDNTTKIPFVVTTILIGAVTYSFVLNMNTITSRVKYAYNLWRKVLITRMQHDEDKWKKRGQKFEEFKPSNENMIPSEWWILIYSFRQLLTKMWWTLEDLDDRFLDTSSSQTASSQSISSESGNGQLGTPQKKRWWTKLWFYKIHDRVDRRQSV